VVRQFWDVFYLVRSRNGEAVSVRVYPDRAEARWAAGLSQ
jgi:hypothetical protein